MISHRSPAVVLLSVAGAIGAGAPPAEATAAVSSAAPATGSAAASKAPAGRSDVAATRAAPSTDAIARTLQRTARDRVREGWAGAIVAGVRGPDGRTRIVTAGRADGGRALDGASVFEIGSVTKTFTATLLADAAQRGEVTLTQPVAELLPPGTTVPSFPGARPISLTDLATQTSGLPRLPTDLADGIDPADPYAHYSRQRLLAGLGQQKLASAPGTAYAYSNLGFGLLGDALSIRTGQPFAQLVQDRIAGPLGLTSTGITLSAGQRARFVPGHDGDGVRVPAWTFDALAGAGALRSTTTDLLRYAAANLAAPTGPGTLGKAMADAQAEHWSSAKQSQGLAWVRQPAAGRTLVWHNGGTAAHQSFVGLDPSRGTAVVVLSDTGGLSDVTDLGLNALERTLPLDDLPKFVDVSASALSKLTGTYRIDGTDYAITRERGTLVVTVGGQRAFVLHPTSQTAFLSKAQDVQVTFVVGRGGNATGLKATLQGETATGRRVGK